jgi:large subunit ribosomal protein L30
MATKKAKRKTSEEAKTIRIRQVRSAIATPRTHREVLRGLGLRHPHHEVERPDNPAIRGMVAKVRYLVDVIEDAS